MVISLVHSLYFVQKFIGLSYDTVDLVISEVRTVRILGSHSNDENGNLVKLLDLHSSIVHTYLIVNNCLEIMNRFDTVSYFLNVYIFCLGLSLEGKIRRG